MLLNKEAVRTLLH